MASVTMQISSLIDSRFDNFKKQFTEENSSSVEAAVKRAKRARFVFQSKGNEQQFEHAESVLDKLESAKGALNANAISKAKTAIDEGIALVTKRMKVIKIADKSQYSWATVQEYLSDELASDSEDEKRLFRSERRAEKKVKDSKKKRSQKYQHQRFQPYPPFNPNHRSSLPTLDAHSNTGSRFGRDLGVRGRQIGPAGNMVIWPPIVLAKLASARRSEFPLLEPCVKGRLANAFESWEKDLEAPPFVMDIIRQGPSWDVSFTFSEALLQELKFWLQHIDSFNGYSIRGVFCAESTIYTDASDFAFGGYLATLGGEPVR
ncbi:unnamed protein product, partial [Porites lobata]